MDALLECEKNQATLICDTNKCIYKASNNDLIQTIHTTKPYKIASNNIPANTDTFSNHTLHLKQIILSLSNSNRTE